MYQRTVPILYFLAAVTYSQTVKPILNARCVECHSTGSDLDLSHFPFTCKTIPDQAAIVDRMLVRVGSNPPQMPPGNRPKLVASEVSSIRQWRDDGLAP